MLTETMNVKKAVTCGPVWVCAREGFDQDGQCYETVCDRCSLRDQDLRDRWLYVRPARAGDACNRCLKPIVSFLERPDLHCSAADLALGMQSEADRNERMGG